MGQDVHPGADFHSVLLATADLGLQNQLRENLAQEKCAVLALASLEEAGNAALVLHFDRIILDLALCKQPRDLAEFTGRLRPGQQLVILHEANPILPEADINPRCHFRPVARTSHPGILLKRLRMALAGGSRNPPYGSLARKDVSVLLVDPDPIAQDIVLHNLISQGYLVLSIPNPIEAAHTAQDIFFDVLMVDALLP